MAEEHPSPGAADRPENEEAPDEGTAPGAGARGSLPSGLTEIGRPSATQNLLREAIEKVKAEIAYHESESRKHRQKAEELRKELRDCFAFFQQAGGKAERAAVVKESPPAGNAEAATAGKPRESEPAARRPRVAGRKKRRGRKAREA
jgi:hypothetical protein